ncbi:hypothetical protein DFQ26_001908, partial [Actinomortierella ambigua]
MACDQTLPCDVSMMMEAYQAHEDINNNDYEYDNSNDEADVFHDCEYYNNNSEADIYHSYYNNNEMDANPIMRSSQASNNNSGDIGIDPLLTQLWTGACDIPPPPPQLQQTPSISPTPPPLPSTPPQPSPQPSTPPQPSPLPVGAASAQLEELECLAILRRHGYTETLEALAK